MIPEDRWKQALIENPGKAIFCYMLFKYGKHNLTLFEQTSLGSERLRQILKCSVRPRSTDATLRAYWKPSRIVSA